jgi:adenosylcobinamide-GDP ribazoletransferase
MKKLKLEFEYFCTAVQFLSRIPVPEIPNFTNLHLQRSRTYFPLVGTCIGVLVAGIWWASTLIFPVSIALLLSMAFGLLLTGGFHEDGFTDTCDGLGGGWTTAQKLNIMKDSRIGAYGVLGILMLMLIKFKSLEWMGEKEIYRTGIWMITAHTWSRFCASMQAQFLPYVQDIEVSKIRPLANQKLSGKAIMISLCLAMLPFFFQGLLLESMIAIGVSILLTIGLAWYYQRQIGGYTGDCLGATQQLTELSIYLSSIALWNCI